MGHDVVAAAGHVVDDGIGVDSHTGAARKLEHNCGTNCLAAPTCGSFGSSSVSRRVSRDVRAGGS
jgi:hypothetical protein